MNESRRMLQQLPRVQYFADGGPTKVLFGAQPGAEDTVPAPMAGPTLVSPAAGPAPMAGPTLSTAGPAPMAGPMVLGKDTSADKEHSTLPISTLPIELPPPPTYATRSQIEDIYRNTLGRAGEQAGLDWWAKTAQEANLSPEQLRAEIVKSQEFQGFSPYDVDKSGGVSEAERRAAINQVYQNIFAREGEQAGLDYWQQSGLTPEQMQKHFNESKEWGTLSPFDVNVDLRLSPAERAAYEESLLKKPVELPKGREAMPLPEAPPPIDLPKVEVRNVPEVKPPELDTKFRESPARTFDPVTGSFQYTAPTKLAAATGAGMTFVPPTVTSRARQLLNVGFTLGGRSYDPLTNTLYEPALSASQRYGADRTRQLGALQQAISQAGFQPSSSGTIRLQNQLRAGGFRKADGTIDVDALRAAVASLKPTTQAGPPAPAPAGTPVAAGNTSAAGTPPPGFGSAPPVSFSSGSSLYAPASFTDTGVPQDFRSLDPIRFSQS
jgi:hypothetical protein